MKIENALKFMLWLTAAIAIGSGFVVFVGGAERFPFIENADASADSELRFFAAFWMAYGWFAAWIARDLETRNGFVRPIAIVMIVGAIGRILSYFTAGPPSPYLILGIVVEATIGLLVLELNRRHSIPAILETSKSRPNQP